MAKKKNAKAAKATSVRPRTSPYTSSPTIVYFGVDRQRYYVPDVLLEQFENPRICDPWTRETHFEDVDAGTGHVMIHYLHTGIYQTLNGRDHNEVDGFENEIVINEFQKAMRVVEAATKYGLSGLQQLAQSEMEQYGTQMNLQDAVRAIGEKSIAGPLNENIWLRDYVSQKVRSTFRKNVEMFTEPEFFDRITSPTLTKLLAKSVISLYSEKVFELQKKKLADEKPSPPVNGDLASNCSTLDLTQLSYKRLTPSSEIWPESVEKFGAFDDSSAAWGPHTPSSGTSFTPGADAPKSAAQTTKKSKKSKKMARLQKIAEHAKFDATRVDVPEPIPAQIIPISVVQDAIDVVVEPNEVKTKDPSAADAAEAEQNKNELAWSGWVAAAIPLKKAKKKKGANLDIDAAVSPPHAAEPVLEPPPVNLEPESEFATEVPRPELEPEPKLTVEAPCIEKEGDTWGDHWGATLGSSKMTKKKGAAVCHDSPPPSIYTE